MHYFFEHIAIFLGIATVKTSYVLKRARQGLLMEGYTNIKRLWVHDEEVMFSSHDLKKIVFHHDPMTFSNLYILPLKALSMLLSEQVLFSL